MAKTPKDPAPPTAAEPPPPPERRRPKHQAKAVAPRKTNEVMIVVSNMEGIYRCAHQEYRGYDEHAKQELMESHKLDLKPGANLVNVGLWEVVQGNPGMKRRQKSGHIATFEDLTGEKDPSKVRARRIEEIILRTASVETLQHMAKDETRGDVLEAYEAQIAACDHRNKHQQVARSLQRSHTRSRRPRIGKVQRANSED